MIGEITYSYVPSGWDQERFLSLGGFTVVFLNYNKMPYIEKSVESALNQDFPLLEMFFMDDASADGSGDEMERIVREYCGRHKVTVVRNDVNQNITGQWNIVSRLATGNWFGMFCGDDWSYPDRVSNAARRIKEFPTIKGLCASGVEVGKRGMKVGWSGDVVVENGVDSLWQMAEVRYPLIGASAFWHKSLFADSLPLVRLDDLFLRWRLQYLYQSESSPVWLWDGQTNAIKYSFGSGITTAAYTKQDKNERAMDRWLANTRSMKHFARLAAESYLLIGKWLRTQKADRNFRLAARYCRLQAEIKAGNTWSRMILLPSVCTFVVSAQPSLCRGMNLMKTWIKSFVKEFAGLWVAALISSKLRRG